MDRPTVSDNASTFYTSDPTVTPSALAVQPVLSRGWSFANLSVGDILGSVSDAFVGLVQDLFRSDMSFFDALQKDQRYLYLSLLVIGMLIVGDLLNTWDL